MFLRRHLFVFLSMSEFSSSVAASLEWRRGRLQDLGRKEDVGGKPFQQRDLPSTAFGDLDKDKAEKGGLPNNIAGGGAEVINMMKQLNLTTKEATLLILEDENDEDPLCHEWALMEKVLVPNLLHINTITYVFRTAQENPRGLLVRSMRSNLFLAEFGSEADKIWVAKGGPWCLSKHAILLKDFDIKVKLGDVVFDELHVWARILNLSYELMNFERGTLIAACLGRVHVEVAVNGRAWGSYLWTRVSIDKMQPLMSFVSLFSKKKNMISHYEVMYERLPVFCFSHCLMGHSYMSDIGRS